MSNSLDHLLPAPDEAVRCAEHARTITLDPGGTAIRADRVVVVTTPLPWPKPALDHPLLTVAAEVARHSARPTRLLAAAPDDNGPGLVVVYDRVGGTAIEARHRIDAADPDAPDALAALVVGPAPAEAHTPARPALLICTQGSHDVCCGSEGARLAEELAGAKRSGTGFELFRVSHTGGHRFAPTAMTIPDGRMWSGLDASDVEAIFSQKNPSPEGSLIDRCRGWWGADTGSAQIAERAVFAELGWSLDAQARSVEVATAGDTAAETTCVVTTATHRWTVELELGREVPTIACRAQGGLPTKMAQEYRVVSVSRS